MEQIGWQIIVRCRDNRVFAPPGIARLSYIDAVLTHGMAHGLYTHGLGDTHGHLGTTGSRKQAGELARRLLLTLHHSLPGAPAFEPARIVPIHDQQHLGNLVNYCLGQDKHHKLGLDPLREATAAFDYLGLRPKGDFLREQLRGLLPRFTNRAVLAHLPAPPTDSLELPFLLDAARSVTASSLVGNTPETTAFRLAAIHAAAGAPAKEIAAALGLSRRTVERQLSRVPDTELVRAIRLQMGLRTAFSGMPPRVSTGAAANLGTPPAGGERFDSFESFLMAEFDAAQTPA